MQVNFSDQLLQVAVRWRGAIFRHFLRPLIPVIGRFFCAVSQFELLQIKVCKINIINEHDCSLAANCREVMMNLVGRNPIQGRQFVRC
ncbi:Uncharacterised protein [Shigella flexneri]|nr:Uncharacterised protein [Shigella flexneri]